MADAPLGDLAPGAVSLRRADKLRDTGRYAEAAAEYRKTHQLLPERDDILVQLGNMLKDSGEYGPAERAYQEALERSERADTHLQLGHLYKLTGDRDAAIHAYRRALALDPDSSGAAQELAAAGDALQQRRNFTTSLQAGGVELLLSLSHAVADMRRQLDTIGRMLPDAAARVAFPISLYDVFRQAFPIPQAPGVDGPPLHIILLAERESIDVLFGQIGAVQNQVDPRWRLTVLGHSSERRRVVELAATVDRRVNWFEVTEGISDAIAESECCAAVEEPWLLLLGPGAMLDREASGWFITGAAWSGAAAFFCDEELARQTHSTLTRSDPQLRGAADFDTLLTANTLGETVAIRTEVFRRLMASLPCESTSASRTSLLLHLCRDGRLGHIPFPLVWYGQPAPVTPGAHDAGVAAFLATCLMQPCPSRRPEHAPQWLPEQPNTSIAVIIPTRDNGADVLRMVRSLRETAVAPAAIEIIVLDNGTVAESDRAILAGLAEDERVKVLRRDGPFNWSHLNNGAANCTDAAILVFANDDMRMVTAGWDDIIRGLLARPDVGVVGVRLLFDDDTIQHAGILMGWRGSVIHDGLHEPADADGPSLRFRVPRSAAAVTGAFLATTRACFAAVGGFDAEHLPVAYSDVDLALKLRSLDKRVIWTPAITLYHHESKTRGLDHTDPWRASRNAAERAVMEARWGNVLDMDPSVSPLWQDATLPFRLIAAPSLAKVRDHIVRTGASNPWLVQQTGATARGSSPPLR